MKVLKNNYDYKNKVVKNVSPYPRKMICECCDSELEYEEVDVKIGAFGCAYVTCPLCRETNFIDDGENELTLTKNNVEFPTHFWHTSKENGAVDCCNNKEIKECIHRAINFFRENKDKYNWFTATGNLYVVVYRLDGDESYEVMVTKDYYETSIPFEDVDY